jgi:hypothetical protein
MTVSRITLPENFADWNSAQLLAQPEPQYPFAGLFLSAIASSLSTPNGIGLDGRQITGAGAAFSSAERDRLELAQGLPSGLWALGVDFKSTMGGTVRVNRPAFANTTYTAASRRLSPGQTISTTPITIGMEQTHLVLERYAGPYDTANSRVAPYALEAFDAKMGLHSPSSMIGTHLKRDFHRFLDSVHVVLGDGGTAVYPEGITADADITSTDSAPMTVEQLTRTTQLMDEASLATWPDGKRVMFMHPKQWKQLHHDPEFQVNSSFHKDLDILYGGYAGTVCDWHCFVSSTLGATTNGSSVSVQRAIAMAPGGFMGGMGRPPMVKTSTADNYGETALCIWLADLAFGISDSRFFRSVRSG